MVSSFPPDSEAEDRLIAKDQAGDNAAPLSVSEISSALKRTVEERFGFVRIRGELSRVTQPASGHLYFALKDDKAKIDGVMWRGTMQRLSFRPEEGLEVIASGKLTTYPGKSSYQIVVERMELAGEGALLALLARTKARLEAEGLFAPERKKPLPFLPRTIGVITSPTGAVIRDILHRLADRFPSRVLVWPVLVQGQGSAEQVAMALRGFSDLAKGGPIPRPDLIIVARGGGSIEDLWGFNEEVVVRAIADSTIPVISAIGHETDTTLADFAADLRAPTPTAAAELAVPVREDLQAQLLDLNLRQRRAIYRPVQLGRERLAARADRLPKPQDLLAAASQRLDNAGEALRRALSGRVVQAQMKLQRSSGGLSVPLLRARWQRAHDRLGTQRLVPMLITRRIGDDREKVAVLARMAEQLSPARVLARGYAIVRDGAGNPVMRARDAAQHPPATLEFHDGRVELSGQAAVSSPKLPKARQESSQAPHSHPQQGKLL